MPVEAWGHRQLDDISQHQDGQFGPCSSPAPVAGTDDSAHASTSRPNFNDCRNGRFSQMSRICSESSASRLSPHAPILFRKLVSYNRMLPSTGHNRAHLKLTGTRPFNKISCVYINTLKEKQALKCRQDADC